MAVDPVVVVDLPLPLHLRLLRYPLHRLLRDLLHCLLHCLLHRHYFLLVTGSEVKSRNKRRIHYTTVIK
jgi:hypothetical protein